VLPDALHLIAIRGMKAQEVFCDGVSKERLTGLVKTKYKLSTKVLPAELGIFMFVLSTSKSSAVSSHTSFSVKEGEWEDRDSDYLHGTSFFDVKKVEPHSVDELLQKRKDPMNGFKRVARLPDSIHSKIDLLFRRARAQTSVPDVTKKLLNAAYADANVAEAALRELNLI